MRRVALLGSVVWLAGGLARAGVGVWTATPRPAAQTVIVGPNGVVYTDWGTQFSDQVARSDDHGVTWQPLPGLGGQIDFYATRALSVDPAGAVYAALNGGGNASFYGDLSVSRDRGMSWTLLARDFQTQDLDLGVDSFSATTLFLHSGLPDVLPFGPLFQPLEP